jgi:putative ABC transport system ATP-binding protein
MMRKQSNKTKLSENSVAVENLVKSFRVGKQDVVVLRGVSLCVEQGKFLIICGPSGCGKSTLLHSMLGLEPPTSGKIMLLGQDLYANGLTEDDRSNIRKQYVGMVYQQPNWVRSLTVVENVALPLQLLGIAKNEALENAHTCLQVVGMTDWSRYLPTELSSGQQQRVALARAIITDPKIIIADEPTGNLDFDTGQNLMRLLQQFSKDMKKTIIMVTHDLEYLKYADETITMFDGRIVSLDEMEEKKGIGIYAKSKKLAR